MVALAMHRATLPAVEASGGFISTRAWLRDEKGTRNFLIGKRWAPPRNGIPLRIKGMQETAKILSWGGKRGKMTALIDLLHWSCKDCRTKRIGKIPFLGIGRISF